MLPPAEQRDGGSWAVEYIYQSEMWWPAVTRTPAPLLCCEEERGWCKEGVICHPSPHHQPAAAQHQSGYLDIYTYVDNYVDIYSSVDSKESIAP